jgi:aspartate/methionine/tyrosine aminotransferase
MASIDNFEFAHQHRTEVAWMSQNTNTLPMHPAVMDAIRRSVEDREFNNYPFKRGLFGLPEAILEDLRLDGLEVLLTNGGIEGEYIATRALLKPGDEVVSTDPAFLPIHDQIAMAGAKPIAVDIYRKPYVLTPEWAADAVTPATKAMFLIDPDNPMGSGYSRSQVKGLAEVAKDQDLLLIDDITYRDFNADHILATDFYPEKALLAYSFSKAPGLAGMRVGALLGPPEIMKQVKRFDTNPLGVNIVSQRAALAALRTKKEWLPGVRAACERNQRIIQAAVDRVDGTSLPVFPSRANMFVIDVSATGVSPEALEERLLHDYLVHGRAGPYLSRLNGRKFFRVSFTVPEKDAKRFAEAFPAVMTKLQA